RRRPIARDSVSPAAGGSSPARAWAALPPQPQGPARRTRRPRRFASCRCRHCEVSSGPPALQIARMESKVILDEARDEKVAVVVTCLQTKIQGDATSPAGFFQQLGLELALQKLVVRALIDQKRRPFPSAALDEGGRVVFPPESAIGSEISRQRFFSPGAAHRRADRR